MSSSRASKVVVTSTFKSDMYEQLLHESLPLDLLQAPQLEPIFCCSLWMSFVK